MIIGVFSELSRVGGVQQVSRHAGATLWDLAAERGDNCELVGLNDPAGAGSFTVGERSYPFRGFGRNKLDLLAHLMGKAPKTSLAVAGHVNLGPVLLGCRMLNRRMRWWVFAHGIEVWEPMAWYRRVALRRATGLLAVSRHTAEAVERVQGAAGSKILVLPLALDPGFCGADRAPVRWPAPEKSLALLTVGRLSTAEPGKGVDLVIRALGRLAGSFPNLYYVVVGGGDALTALRALAEEVGVADRLFFCGELPVGSLRGYYEAADVFVMPSRQEGFGIVYLEAMAVGKPVVAAACGGATDVVRDGENGFLVGIGDVDAMVDRLARLLADADLRARMGDAGRRMVEEKHRYEIFRDRLKACLAE